MGDGTTIEWSDATWNPVTGCSHVSHGCDHCYAETLSLRRGWSKLPWTPDNAEENVILHPERLDMPTKWRRPRMIFVNSMSDLFHPRVPGEFINEIWMQMYNNPRHTYQILTKRPKRLRDWTIRKAHASGWPVEEIWPGWMWVGTSIESREFVDRADLLRETPAAIRFISAEPLLGPLVARFHPDGELGEYGSVHEGQEDPSLDLTGIAWLIVGGESGPGHRQMHASWVRDLRDAVLFHREHWRQKAGEEHPAFFFKQWGGVTPKAGGRILDGREWNEMPTRVAAGAML